jgi:hypothetical protein
MISGIGSFKTIIIGVAEPIGPPHLIQNPNVIGYKLLMISILFLKDIRIAHTINGLGFVVTDEEWIDFK